MLSRVRLLDHLRGASTMARRRPRQAALAAALALPSLVACSSTPAPGPTSVPASSSPVASEEALIGERVADLEKTCPGLFAGSDAPACEKDLETDSVYLGRVKAGDQSAHLHALARYLADPTRTAHRGAALVLLNSALSTSKGGKGKGVLALRPAPYCTDASTAPSLLDALVQTRPANEALVRRQHRVRMGVAFGLGCIDIEGLKLGAKLDETLAGLDPHDLDLLLRYLAIHNQDSPTFLSRAERLVTTAGGRGEEWALEARLGVIQGLLTRTDPPQGTDHLCATMLDLAFVPASQPATAMNTEASGAFVRASPIPGSTPSTSPAERCVAYRDRFLERLEALSASIPSPMPADEHLAALSTACQDSLTPASARERARGLSLTLARKLEPLSDRFPVLYRESVDTACVCDSVGARPLGLSLQKKTGQKVESCKL